MNTEDIEKIAMDKLKNKWGHLYISGYPQKPFPHNYQSDLDMIKVGIYEALEYNKDKIYTEEDLINAKISVYERYTDWYVEVAYDAKNCIENLKKSLHK